MDTRKFAMNQGAVLGLCLVCIIILWMLGINEQKSIVPSLLNNVVIIWFLVYSISQYRDRHNNGCISYSESLKLGTSVVFFFINNGFLYNCLCQIFRSDMLSNILKMTEQSVLQSNPEISEDELDLALEMTSKLTQPHWIMIMSVLGGTFMGFFLSLFISFFIKKRLKELW